MADVDGVSESGWAAGILVHRCHIYRRSAVGSAVKDPAVGCRFLQIIRRRTAGALVHGRRYLALSASRVFDQGVRAVKNVSRIDRATTISEQPRPQLKFG